MTYDPPDGTYQALLGERTFDLTFEDGELRVDGKAVAYSAEPFLDGQLSLIIDGRSLPAVVEPLEGDHLRVTIEGRRFEVRVKDEKALLQERFGLNDTDSRADHEVRAPMPGLVLNVLVEPGQGVEPGDGLIVLEAMKMENELRATAKGTVQAIHAAPGDAVSKNALLVELA